MSGATGIGSLAIEEPLLLLELHPQTLNPGIFSFSRTTPMLVSC